MQCEECECLSHFHPSQAFSDASTLLRAQTLIPSLPSLALCVMLLSPVASRAMATCRVALCQLLVGADKAANLVAATNAIAEAAANKANIIALPECFNGCVGAWVYEMLCGHFAYLGVGIAM